MPSITWKIRRRGRRRDSDQSIGGFPVAEVTVKTCLAVDLGGTPPRERESQTGDTDLFFVGRPPESGFLTACLFPGAKAGLFGDATR